MLALAWILALVLKVVSMSAERVIGAARACPALVRSDVRRLRRRPTRSSDHGLRRVTGPRDLGGVQARATAPDAPSTSSATAAGTGRKVSRNPKVCVVGGGFGGLYTALRLSTLVWPGNSKPEITLVDQRDRFVFKPLLYELLTEELELDEVAPRFVDVLSRSGVRFQQGKVGEILPRGEEDGEGKVRLEGGAEIDYDYLVVAFGSGTRLDNVEGAEENAMPFCNLEDAIGLKEYLRREAGEGRRPKLAVVGGGVNGVELAASLADRCGDQALVQVITPGEDILESYPKDQRRNAWNALSAGGVEVRLGTKVRKIEKGAEDGGRYRLSVENAECGEEVVEVDKVLWTAGQKPSPIPEGVRESGAPGGSGSPESSFFTRNESGNVVTDENLRMVDSSYVFALGDIAVLAGEKESKYTFTAQVAFQQSDYVAWNVWSTINNQPLLPFQYQHLGDMMSLGQSEATVALPIGGLNLTGLPASLLRKTAYIYRMPTLEYTARLGFNWASKLLMGK